MSKLPSHRSGISGSTKVDCSVDASFVSPFLLLFVEVEFQNL